MAVQIQYRRGTAAEWTAANPVLAVGEPGYEIDSGNFKVGNGIAHWDDLPYNSGPQGDTGDQGPAGTVAVGTTTTGNAGTSAAVTNSGTSSAAVLDFTIPRGDKGDKGDKGDGATVAAGTTTTGNPGTNASVTNVGTSGDAVFNFTIPRGDTGTAATVAVGSTTTGAAGSNASVSNSGTSAAAVLNFTIPRGDTGLTGPTGPAAPKALTIINPTDSEKVPLFFTAGSITFAQIRSLVKGSSSPSVTFSIRYGTDFSQAGTEVVTSGITVTSTTTGLSTTSFNNATVPANSWVWLTTSATAGTVNALNVSLVF
jgi:hypothetical protein